MPAPPRDRGPRKPIKGRRKTFDVDSAPNARERADLAKRAKGGSEGEESKGAPRTDDRWVDEGPVRQAAGAAVRRGAKTPTEGSRRRGSASSGDRKGHKPSKGSGRNDRRDADRAAKRAGEVLEIDEARMRRKLGAPRAARTLQRLGEASNAFAQDRYQDAVKTLKPLAELVPEEPVIRELYGLTLYRLGRWKAAAAELEEFSRLSRSVEQHPVLADCERALGRHDRVEELWAELGEASPAAALVAEGRIVYAGSLADQGSIVDAIKVLEGGSLGTGKLKAHHLRMRYALGDLYERAGERQSARRQFEAIAERDPSFVDVAERLSGL